MGTTKTATAVDTERVLRESVDKATEELSEIQTRAAAHRDQIATKREYLRRRTVDHPEDFDSTGEPKKGTGAAKLASEIHKLVERDKFNALIHGAEQRLREAESSLLVHRRDYAHELFAEMRPEAEAAVDAWVAWVEQGWDHYRRMAELTEPVVVIAHRSRAYSPRDVPNYESEKQTLRAMSSGRPPLPLPRLFVAELEAEQAEEAEGTDDE